MVVATFVPRPRVNKKIIPWKRLRNKIAGFTTHLMKRIQKGASIGEGFKS